MKNKNKYRKSKEPPYFEILNLNVELKEYKDLCKGKSQKFIYYLDWKEHISHELYKIDDLVKMENYKHYLINNCRVNKSIYVQFVPLGIFYFTLLIGNLFPKADFVSVLLGVAISLFFILWQNNYYNKEYYFYCDIIEILEEIEKKEKDICPTPKPPTKKP